MADTPQCLWCDRPATHYCDAVLGFEAVAAARDRRGKVTGLLTGTNAQGKCVSWTCDAPMCARHAKRVGHVCCRGSKGKSDTIDHCPYHVERGGCGIRDRVMFAAEVEPVRRAIHASVRREATRERNRHG